MGAFGEPPVDAVLLQQQAAADRARAARPGRAGDGQAARRAAEEFEAVFLARMLAPMFVGLEGGAFGGGPGEQVYRQMLVEQYGKSLARNGGIGIADQVQREILKLQEVDEP